MDEEEEDFECARLLLCVCKGNCAARRGGKPPFFVASSENEQGRFEVSKEKKKLLFVRREKNEKQNPSALLLSLEKSRTTGPLRACFSSRD